MEGSLWGSYLLVYNSLIGYGVQGLMHPAGGVTPENIEGAQQNLSNLLRETLFQEYGVLHLYSGFANISNYPPIPVPIGLSPDEFWLIFSAKLSLAIRRNQKQAYAAIGLNTVWSNTRKLQTLTGDAPFPVVDPNTVWSLKEINELLGSAFRDPSAQPPPSTYQT